jgi:hypothetical protein
MKHLASLLAAGASLLLLADAQAQTRLRLPQLSPTTFIRQNFSTSYISLTYARPSLRGREVFGKLEPYGTVWRTGANSITKVRFGEDVSIGGQAVPAGTYALLSIPDKKEWTFILNRDTAQWGAYDYKQAQDVLRVKAKPTSLAAPVETMALTIENLKPTSADLVLSWDRTRVALPITANPDPIVMAQIQEAMKGEKKPYISAAQQNVMLHLASACRSISRAAVILIDRTTSFNDASKMLRLRCVPGLMRHMLSKRFCLSITA